MYPPGGLQVTWDEGTGDWTMCGLVGKVFGVSVCLSPAAKDQCKDKLSPPSSPMSLCDHVAHVLAQLLDNDADGKADDERLTKFMVANNYYLVVPSSEKDFEAWTSGAVPPPGTPQMTGLFEAYPGSCDTPINRGASNTDRATWVAAVDNTPGKTSCDPRRDATTEEVLHLMTAAAGAIWPETWGPQFASTAGGAVAATNGNCGWGFAGNYKNPRGSSPACSGQYAYDDSTCDEGCIVVEGVYWASVAWMGGLMTNDRASSVAQEWQMTVPDATMASALPSGQANAKTLEEGAKSLFNLVSDTTSDGHKWLPKIMPDGNYIVGSGPAPAPAPAPGPAPGPAPSGPTPPSGGEKKKEPKKEDSSARSFARRLSAGAAAAVALVLALF